MSAFNPCRKSQDQIFCNAQMYQGKTPVATANEIKATTWETMSRHLANYLTMNVMFKLIDNEFVF